MYFTNIIDVAYLFISGFNFYKQKIKLLTLIFILYQHINCGEVRSSDDFNNPTSLTGLQDIESYEERDMPERTLEDLEEESNEEKNDLYYMVIKDLLMKVAKRNNKTIYRLKNFSNFLENLEKNRGGNPIGKKVFLSFKESQKMANKTMKTFNELFKASKKAHKKLQKVEKIQDEFSAEKLKEVAIEIIKKTNSVIELLGAALSIFEKIRGADQTRKDLFDVNSDFSIWKLVEESENAQNAIFNLQQARYQMKCAIGTACSYLKILIRYHSKLIMQKSCGDLSSYFHGITGRFRGVSNSNCKQLEKANQIYYTFFSQAKNYYSHDKILGFLYQKYNKALLNLKKTMKNNLDHILDGSTEAKKSIEIAVEGLSDAEYTLEKSTLDKTDNTLLTKEIDDKLDQEEGKSIQKNKSKRTALGKKEIFKVLEDLKLISFDLINMKSKILETEVNGKYWLQKVLEWVHEVQIPKVVSFEPLGMTLLQIMKTVENYSKNDLLDALRNNEKITETLGDFKKILEEMKNLNIVLRTAFSEIEHLSVFVTKKNKGLQNEEVSN